MLLGKNNVEVAIFEDNKFFVILDSMRITMPSFTYSLLL
jgi:hypothetical protein